MMAPTTPTGTRVVKACTLSSMGMVVPWALSASDANHWYHCTWAVRLARCSRTRLPLSCDSITASSGMAVANRSARRRSSAARSWPGLRLQAGKARRAASTVRSMSRAPPMGAMAQGRPVAGSMLSTSSPSIGVTHSPLMYKCS